MPELAPSFWEKVVKTDTCWVWTAFRRNGYGRVKIKQREHQAHRVSYEALVGPIPEGLQIDHLCRNRACVNPAHMEPVTTQENSRRGVSYWSLKTHCPQGHPYDETNTYHGNDGRRDCRACARERWHRRKDTSDES